MADGIVHQPSEWTVSAGALQIGALSVSHLAESVGTPLYIYDAAVIRRQYDAVAGALRRFSVAYSIKANPSLGVCRLLESLGCWAEIASGGEMLVSQAAGFSPAVTMFAGPAKQEWELREACSGRVGILNVESWRELEFAASWTNQASLPSICVRVNTNEVVASAGERMTGGPSRFGFDEEELPEVLARYASRLRFGGLHVYTGSQILEAREITKSFRRTLNLFMSGRRALGERFSTVVFGGGFGVPNCVNEAPLDLACVAEGLNRAIDESQVESQARFIIELGRFLVASAGIFVTRVVDVKESRGAIFVMTDGGINNFLRPAFMNVAHPLYVLNRLGEPNEVRVNVGGPLCTPLDVFAEDIEMPRPRIGDLVGVFNAGAYGYSMSMHQFLGHRSPAEVLVNGEAVCLLRPQGALTDLIRDET